MATTLATNPLTGDRSAVDVKAKLNDLAAQRTAGPSTPLATKSVSGTYTFSSPGSNSRDGEDAIIFELDPRHLKAGFSGDGRPRCVWRYGYTWHECVRVGDISQTSYVPGRPMQEHVLYETDLRFADLTLMRTKFERVVRNVHLEYLQLSQKPRKAALLVSPLTPSKILAMVLGVLFNHCSQPTSITLLTTPIMSCVAAGLRSGLVIDVGWEETIVSAVSEYYVIAERRTHRGGKLLLEMITDLLRRNATEQAISTPIDFDLAEEVMERLAWCATEATASDVGTRTVSIPLSEGDSLKIPFGSLNEATHQAFFARESSPSKSGVPDDDDHSIPALAYRVLCGLPRDIRGACAQRIIVDGSQSRILGLRGSILSQLQTLINARSWDIVDPPSSQDQSSTPRHGSPVDAPADASSGAQDGTPSQLSVATEDLTNTSLDSEEPSPIQGRRKTLAAALSARAVPAGLRPQDDTKDHVTQKAEREARKRRVQPFSGKVRVVDTLGAWAGASIVMSMKIKGVCEIEREDFLKHGLRDSVSLLI